MHTAKSHRAHRTLKSLIVHTAHCKVSHCTAHVHTAVCTHCKVAHCKVSLCTLHTKQSHYTLHIAHCTLQRSSCSTLSHSQTFSHLHSAQCTKHSKNILILRNTLNCCRRRAFHSLFKREQSKDWLRRNYERRVNWQTEKLLKF